MLMFCSIIRWQLSAALDRDGQPRRVAAHLTRCDGCRKFAADLESLHRRLSASVKNAPRPLAAERRPRAVVRGALALAVAGAVALAFLAWPGDRKPEPAGKADQVAVIPITPQVDDVPSPRPTREVVDRLGRLFAVPAPLRAELDALAADGRRGALTILDLGGVGDLAERLR
jgi:hypothetical protein